MNQRGKCLRRLALKKIVIGQLFASLALTLTSVARTEAATIRAARRDTTQQGINVAPPVVIPSPSRRAHTSRTSIS